MISGVRTIINNSPLFGCSDAGEISSSGDQQRSIAIAAIRSDNLDFSAHLEEDIDINPRQKGQRIAKIVKKVFLKELIREFLLYSLMVYPELSTMFFVELRRF